jgi:hypothetical protein
MKKGGNRNMAILLVVILAFSIVPTISGTIGHSEDSKQWIPISSDEPKKPEIRILAEDESGITLKIDVYGMYREKIDAQGQTFDLLTIPEYGWVYKVGEPQVPAVRTFVALLKDEGPQVTIRNIEYSTLEGYYIFPAQEPLPESQEEGQFEIDEELYSTHTYYPDTVTDASDIMWFGRLPVSLLSVHPVQFNPVEQKLKVCSSIEIRIDFQGAPIKFRPISPDFDSIYKNVVFNYEELKRKGFFQTFQRSRAPNGWDSFSDQQADYLIITHDDFYSSILPLANWKRRQGLKVDVVKTSDIASTPTVTDIKNYIQDAYDDWTVAPSYVLLVGDVGYLPTDYPNSWASDHTYAKVAGADDLPDINVGRLPVGTTTELTYIVRKIVDYEESPYMAETAWYRQACTWHSEERWQWPDTCTYVRNKLLANGYTTVDYFHDTNGGSTADDLPNCVVNAINDGRTFYLYRAHGSITRQAGSNNNYSDNLSIADLQGLNNGRKLTLFIDPTCQNGHFDESSGDCFGEVVLKAGNQFDIKGGVGFYGSSRVSFTGYNDELARGFFNEMFDNSNWNFGPCTVAAEIYMYGIYGDSTAIREMEMFNVLGDPELEVWTGIPQKLNVWHFPAILVGNHDTTVVVRDAGGLFLQGATVCLMKDNEIHTVGTTDADGKVVFNVNIATVGTMDVTVTKHNFIPYEGTISVIDTCKPVDLIFVIDVTGSMSDDIDAVQASAITIVNTIESMTCDFRVGIVAYRDHPFYPYGEPDDVMFEDYAFSTDKTTIINNINSLVEEGGADWKEAVFDALLRAIDSTSIGEWRSGVKKILILMGDAPPHDPCPIYGYTALDVINAAFLADPATIYSISVGHGISVGCSPAVYEAFKEISEGTGGKAFCAPTANDVVDVLLETLGIAIIGSPRLLPPAQPVFPPPDYNQMMRPLARENIKKAEVLILACEEAIDEAKAEGKDTAECEELLKQAKEALEKAYMYFAGGNYTAANYWAVHAIKLLTKCREYLENL